jgi:hypothetical protein
MRDNADPLNGWSTNEVEDTSSGPATADIYGKLFYHVRAVLRAFLLRLSGLQVSFRLFQVDASDLPDYLKAGSFSRIEVRRYSRLGYVLIFQSSVNANPLLVGLQYFGRRISWNTSHDCLNGALASGTSYQLTCDPHYSIHECC